MHMEGPRQWPTEQIRDEPRRSRAVTHTFTLVESRTKRGSARSRLPDGGHSPRPNAWYRAGMQKKPNSVRNTDPRRNKAVLYKLADICTDLTRQRNGVLGDVARALGGGTVRS